MFDFYAFIRKKWAEYSRASGRKGTVIDDLAIKPSALLMVDFYNSLVEQRKVNNINEWESMTESELNFFGNKFFNYRVEGSLASTYIRVYFDEKKDLVITDNFRAVSSRGFQYLAASPGYISKSSFKNSDNTAALYFVDINIVASSPGNNYIASKNTISQLINVNFVYKYATNPEDTVGGSTHENNQQYFNRLKYSINDHSLVNKGSIFNILKTNFPTIGAMYIAGSGDRYMLRDLLTATDLSNPIMRADYLGKAPGDGIVSHAAYYGIFPPNPGSFQSDTYWGPHSSHSIYNIPLTIEASTETFSPDSPSIQSSDAAFFGFPLDQEADSDMYRGLYFNDYKKYMEVATKDLFNIVDEEVGFVSVQSPNYDWKVGTNGNSIGSFSGLVDDVLSIDVLSFNNDTINFSGGCSNPIVVEKDILKRTGVKLSGSFTWPAVNDGNINSKLQFMVGGANGDTIDGYTGIGFGVMVTKDYDADTLNGIVYIAHSERYGGSQVYASISDLSDHISISGMNALAERAFRIQPGVEYDFEFIVYDDLRVTLYIDKTSGKIFNDPDEFENELHFQLPNKALNIFSDKSRGGILAISSTRYGTMMKITLDTDSILSTDMWKVIGLKAFDINPAKSMALFAINAKDLEDPISIYLRAYGQGSMDGGADNGYQAFVWDRESQLISSLVNSELTRGGWTELSGVTNPDGSKTSITGMLSHKIGNLDRYRVNDNYIYFLIIASGKSQAGIKYNGGINDDVQSLLRIEYIKLQSDSVDSYHSNTKADLYISTIKNFEQYQPITVSVQSSGSYFEINGPVFKILSVSLGGETISDYSIIDPDPDLVGSYLEKKRIVLNDSTATTISVTYILYPEVARVQEFFENAVYGDTLVKHKFPCFLSFTFNYSGARTTNEVSDEVKKYVDQNIDGKFSVNSMISYFYNNNLVNNIKTPIEISYRMLNDDGEEVIGMFTDTLPLRDIDFFYIENLSAQTL